MAKRVPKQVAKVVVAQPAQDVADREEQWSTAIRAHDIGTITQILHDKYINTDAEGNVWKKADDLVHAPSVAELSDPAIDPATDVHLYPDPNVPATANFAVVTGSDSIKGTNYRWTDTWVFIDGQWQCVASHTSRI
jgi:Domain of unknown function (DUF4440)